MKVSLSVEGRPNGLRKSYCLGFFLFFCFFCAQIIKKSRGYRDPVGVNSVKKG